MRNQTALPIDETRIETEFSPSCGTSLASAAASELQEPCVWVILKDHHKARLLIEALALEAITAREIADLANLPQLLNASPNCRAWIADVEVNYPPLGIPLGFVLRGLTPTLPIFGLTNDDSVTELLRLSRLGADQALSGAQTSGEHARFVASTVQVNGKVCVVTGCVKENDLVTTSPAVARLVSQARKLARTQTSILVTGPTGSGKELLAGIICKARGNRPLVSLNCAAVPESLIESELFGFEQGAYTGASKSSEGLIAQADGGVLFLDEIGELSLQTQAKLLRVLDTGELRALGGGDVRRVHFQLVCATHKNLEALSASGMFRQDLYFRIAGTRLKMSALNDRRADIPLLAQYFAAHCVCSATGLPVTFSGPALEKLGNMAWPGNVRELKNFVRQCVSICGSHVISPDVVQQTSLSWTSQLNLSLMRDLLTREALLLALQICEWQVSEVAKLSGRNRTDVYRLIKRFRLKKQL